MLHSYFIIISLTTKQYHLLIVILNYKKQIDDGNKLTIGNLIELKYDHQIS